VKIDIPPKTRLRAVSEREMWPVEVIGSGVMVESRLVWRSNVRNDAHHVERVRFSGGVGIIWYTSQVHRGGHSRIAHTWCPFE
jgi:hypothetical protein